MSRNNKSNLIKEIKVDDQIISNKNKVAEPLMIISLTLGQN